MRFFVYKHYLVIGDEQLICRKFICLKDDNNQIKFTNFHKYIFSKKQNIRNISNDGNNRFDFIVKFLNYIYFYKNLNSITNIKIDDIKEYLNKYGTGQLPGDIQARSKSTVEACINTILTFTENLIEDKSLNMLMTKDELYFTQSFRNYQGKLCSKKIPVFTVKYKDKEKNIFRDMPNAAFELLFSHIYTYHKDILMLVALSAFAGLRPSEACNVRREDSELGPGLIFTYIGNKISKIEIDLRTEKCLRSDLKSTGRIKKERLATVPIFFIDAFIEVYNEYMRYLKGKKYEKKYGPLSLNISGKAITYDSYYGKFRKIIKNEIIPLFLANDNPEVVNYGRLLCEFNISPHIFRHWYTVQLVLFGVDNVAELMTARGDKNPESSLTYLKNKGALLKQYEHVNNETFDYFSWLADKEYGE